MDVKSSIRNGVLREEMYADSLRYVEEGHDDVGRQIRSKQTQDSAVK